jgi:hypothetical protein
VSRRNEIAIGLVFGLAALAVLTSLVLAFTGGATLGDRLGLLFGGFVLMISGVVARRVGQREATRAAREHQPE